jgi:UDP-N-acetylmuramate dehydrogenase
MNFSCEQKKPLSELSTFGIGGPARYYTEIREIEEAKRIISFCHREGLRYLLLGKGSNCLFDDRGFDGVVIANKIAFFEQTQPGFFHVGAGYSFSLLGTQTAKMGWSGLEFASGIPGTVGGAVYMNAGANGNETCHSLASVDFITEEGTLIHFLKEQLHFSYRSSPFQAMRGCIFGALFQLTPSSSARQKQLEIIGYRKKTQPLTKMSAGCIFQNTACGAAGALIDQCGLKGLQIGGAKVSEVHANFIVNEGNATAQNVIELIALIKHRIKEKIGIQLETEVRYIPYSEHEGLRNE